MSDEVWDVRLTAQARRDLRDTLGWTAENFGPEQERVYARTIADALLELGQGPRLVGVKRRDDIRDGLYALHVARNKRRGRHFILFSIASSGERVIEVLRILHDAMDVERRIKTDE